MSIPDFGKSFRDAVFPAASEPETGFNFVVCLGTRPLGDFRSVEGIKYDMPIEKVYEGGRNHSPHLLPFGDKGAGSWGQVTLRWGTPVWSVLYDWMNAVQVGHFFRRDVFILKLGRNGWPSRIMRLHKAFPVTWSAAKLDTGTSDPDLESLVLNFESFNMVLTRVGEMPSLDGMAAAAGRLANLGRDAISDVTSGIQAIGDTAVDLFDGDLFDQMEEDVARGFGRGFANDPYGDAGLAGFTPPTDDGFAGGSGFGAATLGPGGRGFAGGVDPFADPDLDPADDDEADDGGEPA